MWSVRDLGVAALVVIVMGETIAKAFPVYEPVASVTEFGPSSPNTARDGDQFWEHLIYPMSDRLRRTDDSELSYVYHSKSMYKQPSSSLLVGTPPPDKTNDNKRNQRPTRRQQHEAYVNGLMEPALLFKVYL